MTELHLIVRVPNGYGMMTRSEYESLPDPVRARVDVIAVCPSRDKARFVCDCLPSEWRDDVILNWSEDDERADAVEVVAIARR